MREFRAILPNGKTVRVVTSDRDDQSIHDIQEARKRLSNLLDSDRVTEMELLQYLENCVSLIIPTADPSRPITTSTGTIEMGFDLSYGLKNSVNTGVIEIKNPRLGWQKEMSVFLEHIEDIKQLESNDIYSKIEEIYFIAGREGSTLPQEPINKSKSLRVNYLTWDEVVNRIVIEKPDEEAGDYSILLVQLIDNSRLLLRHLAKSPELLDGIEDRDFEKLVATLLYDLGFHEVELTPPRRDGGRDIVAVWHNITTGFKEQYLFELKHWISGGKVGLKWAIKLQNVLGISENARGILISSSGFSPTLLEQEAILQKERIFLKNKADLTSWISVWERRYGNPLLTPVNPVEIIELGN